jgi:tetratricopeptide (TPR) repeat protein
VSLTDDRVIQGVLRWLRDRAETDDEWLFIVDNVDDVSWGIKKIIPKGVRGRILITSRDEQSQKLVDRGCEQIRVDVMSPREASMVLLRHLSDKIDLLPKTVRDGCDEVAKKLGYLPLAIDLAGAYIGNSLTPEQSLTQYLEDYEKHRDELLQMDHLRGLTPTERTVWTVWDTTLRKIEREYTQWHPGLLLTFLANFHGNIVQNEMFRLASHGMFAVNHELGEENFTELQTFIRTTESEWDDFKYRKSVDVLVRYSLIQRVHGHWPGTTIHSLVKWRAIRRDQDQQWQCFYIRFLMAACSEITEEDHKPEFRRHLILHIPDVKNLNLSCIGITKLGEAFVWKTLARVFFDEGRWEEAEQLLMLLIENHESTLGSDHPKTLYSMIGLAATYWSQGRYAEAEQIQVQVMQTNQKKFGEDHIDTLSSMAKLASTYWSQGRYDEAEQIQVQVMQTSQKKFGEDHPYTLQSMLKLASTYWNRGRRKEAEQLHVQVLENSERTPDLGRPMTLMSLDKLAASFRRQGRWEEAEQMQVQAIEIRKRKLGSDHHDTLISMNNLASTYQKQGRWKEAEQVQVQAIEIRKRKFGSDHHDTLISMNNLASTYRDQGRWEEAEQLLVQVIQTSKTKLGEDHPDTLISMANLASTYRNQGRWEEAEQI